MGWLLLAGVCVGHMALVAQEPDVVEWSSTRRLKREDFQGRPPVGATTASMSWLNIEASWECAGGELDATARATFNPARSWWRASQANVWGDAGDRAIAAGRAQLDARNSALQRDAQLLAHEQLHFDLTEVAARNVRSRLSEFKAACDEPGAMEPIRQIVADIDQELQEEQRRYDRETAHGINARAQETWARKVKQMLN